MADLIGKFFQALVNIPRTLLCIISYYFQFAMGSKIVKFIFFGNYFIGILAIALSIETSFQLRLPFNSVPYYLLLFCGTIMYYSYAYSGLPQSFSFTNARSDWYRQHHAFVKWSQLFFLTAFVGLGSWLLIKNWENLLHLSLVYWLICLSIPIAALLYYGLMPKSFLPLNLRNTGWLKAFVIGFVWACCVSLLPIVLLQLERGVYNADPILIGWLFIKNWMFCTVNAIMFDLKDYVDDSNKQLKTFVVRFGLHNTINFILIPLLLIGICFLFAFTHYRHFSFLPILFNLIPFILLLMVAYSMHRKKSILFYLIVIDGLLLVKAICGIVGMQFVLN
jgi:4-hydroxybenzoate polyprenyltransferase